MVEDLSFSYPGKRVLENAATDAIPAGSITALLGPNAAGKSTLFRCLSGLLAPQRGRVLLDGQNLLKLSRAEHIAKVCYMPQSFASNAALTVFEIVLLARKQLQDWRVCDEDIDKVSAILQHFDIAHLAARFIGELSGGQQQIVSLCQAMARRSRVFLLDEPTSALDLRHQLEVMQRVQEMAAENDAVVIAAMHDINLAARFADQILLMKDGLVVVSGPKDEVLCSPMLGEVYGVRIELQRMSDGVHLVGASL